VPVDLTVGPEGIDPPEVTVPAFLSLELAVRNATAAAVTVRVEGSAPTLTVPPGDTARVQLEGKRAGRYAIRSTGPGRGGVLIVGGEPGP